MTLTPEKTQFICLIAGENLFQKMPVSASLSERLSSLEKKMTDDDNKPYDEELYNMMKVSDIKEVIGIQFSLSLVCLKNAAKG